MNKSDQQRKNGLRKGVLYIWWYMQYYSDTEVIMEIEISSNNKFIQIESMIHTVE